MKKSNAAIFALVTFVVGFLAGLMYASFKGPPPGLAGGTAQTNVPAGMPPGQPVPKPDKELEKKIAHLEARVKAEPDNIQANLELANLLFDHTLFDRAVGYYKQALELGGANPDILTDVGVCYRRMGEPQKAVEYFRRARQVDPMHQTSALNLGVVLMHDLQDKDGAIKAWKTYLALDPKGPRAEMIKRTMERISKD